MRYNSAQKAQQALEELAKEGTLNERLNAAFTHLILAGSPDYAQDSTDIIEAYKKANEAQTRGDNHALAEGIREMIQLIFMEEGANDLRSRGGSERS